MPRRGRRPRHRSVATLGVAALAVVAVSLVVTELVASIFVPPVDARLRMWPPNGEHGFRPRGDVFPGVSGPVTFSTNELGLRADPWPSDVDVAILAIGGSTTACTYLDQHDAWPAVLQRRLGAHGRRVWVGNAGEDGLSTRSHVLQMELMLPELPPMDVVIVLAGVNDLLTRLTQHHHYDPHHLRYPDAIEELTLRTSRAGRSTARSTGRPGTATSPCGASPSRGARRPTGTPDATTRAAT